MGRDGTATRERLLDAAQHLFARHGLHVVPIRAINELAGQRNDSALHYHFGSRAGLLVAIVQRHQQAIDSRRAQLLVQAGDEPAAVLQAILGPLAELLGTPDGRDYLRILPQLLGPGYDTDQLPAPPALIDGLARLESHLSGLPKRQRAERLRSLLLTTTTLLADRAARVDSGARPPLGHDTFVGELVAMATGLLLAPNGSQPTRLA